MTVIFKQGHLTILKALLQDSADTPSLAVQDQCFATVTCRSEVNPVETIWILCNILITRLITNNSADLIQHPQQSIDSCHLRCQFRIQGTGGGQASGTSMQFSSQMTSLLAQANGTVQVSSTQCVISPSSPPVTMTFNRNRNDSSLQNRWDQSGCHHSHRFSKEMLVNSGCMNQFTVFVFQKGTRKQDTVSLKK